MANWPNHGAEIDRACMQYAIRNSEPGSLLVEDSKLKMDPNASVCFDIPGGLKSRRRAAADLGPDVPMLCSDASPADKDADADGDTADSYGDDPLPQPVRPPPPTPGAVQSSSQAAVALAYELPLLAPPPPPPPPKPPPKPPGEVPRDAAGLDAGAPAAPPGEVTAAALHLRRRHRPLQCSGGSGASCTSPPVTALRPRQSRPQPLPVAKWWDCRQRRQGCRSARGDLRAAWGQLNGTIAELPPGAKRPGGGSFGSVRLRYCVCPAPLQRESNMSPIIVACRKRLCSVPGLTLSVPHIFRKPSMATCPAATRTVLCSLHAYEKMLDLLSVSCSLSLQSFNIFVKESRVPFCSHNYCFKPPSSNMSVS